MDTIKKFEKSKAIWLIFFAELFFLLLRIPSLIEPYWYGDEGIYQVIGMALDKGRFLYSQIWDNKPPLLYFFYAIAHSDQFTVRFLSMCFGALSIIAFYLLASKLFSSLKTKTFSLIAYIALIATPLVEGNIANAENFMLLPIILAALLIYKINENNNTKKNNSQKSLSLIAYHLLILLAGLLLGIAFLFKIVAVFDFMAFLIFMSILLFKENLPATKKKLYSSLFYKKILFFISGFIIPLTITIIYFISQGTITDFLQAAFFNNIIYVGEENNFLISQGFLILKLLLLATSLFLIFRKRKYLSPEILFIYIWFLFSIFNSLFSGRPWIHYLLTVVPSASLMIGLIIEHNAQKLKLYTSGFLILLILFSIIVFNLNLYSIYRTFAYYGNFIMFTTGSETLDAYQQFFDKNVPRDYKIADFIKSKTKPNDSVFIWGNNPQIYVLADKLPPGKYTAEYHISQNEEAINETIYSIRKSKPKYLIVLPNTSNLPFFISSYVNKFSLEDSDIYEITL